MSMSLARSPDVRSQVAGRRAGLLTAALSMLWAVHYSVGSGSPGPWHPDHGPELPALRLPDSVPSRLQMAWSAEQGHGHRESFGGMGGAPGVVSRGVAVFYCSSFHTLPFHPCRPDQGTLTP